MKKDTIVKGSAEEAAFFMAELVFKRIQKSTLKHSLAISGGSTALLFFKALRQLKIQDKELSKLRLFWVDERCVGPNDSESNYGAAKKELIIPLGISPENVFRIKGELHPTAEASRYENLIQEQSSENDSEFTFDTVFLGMGQDGHTASIFPGNEKIFSSEKLVEISNNPHSGQNRITLTPKCISKANLIYFLVVGKEKASPLAKVFSVKEGVSQLPASRITSFKGEVVWIVDKEAAEGLKEL